MLIAPHLMVLGKVIITLAVRGQPTILMEALIAAARIAHFQYHWGMGVDILKRYVGDHYAP